MVNNVGKTTQTLNVNLGDTNSFTSIESITLLTGELGKGFLLFDPAGTLGVISDYTDDTNFIVTTFARSINLSEMLNAGY